MQEGRQLRRYRFSQNVNLNILSLEREGKVRFRKPNRLFFFLLEQAFRCKRPYILFHIDSSYRLFYIVAKNVPLCLRWKFP